MHEMSTMVRLVNQAAGIIKEQNLKKVRQITVEVGEMTDILPEYLYKYYPEAIKNTPLEGTKLEVRTVLAKAQCLSCGTVFHPSREYDYRCPSCHGIRCKILDGRSVVLASISAEED